ncbi:PP2C family protein-serine/threonine phosphatase [Microbacterium invictum]|uniref:Protein phosphatase 2C domain-containing protein n=1 Tax=Microbacterium invictum TaxID=515415 RepID=A0ABZ0V8Z5_9MICO|nr:protein phosphatase 2C domain-containing protein [Microbacterium invictum]WQB69166.1 protein phosphatase 2C domain-containing protein [Microbacterium invictum]
MTLRLESAAASASGPRPSNQDSAFAAPWGAGVADGVGGGPAGDLASAAFVHRLVAGWHQAPDAEMLTERTVLANWDLAAHAHRDPRLAGMATTFTGLFVGHRGRLLLAHIGDSRAYSLRSGTMTRMTRDDSFVQALVDGGHVRAEDASTHPHRNLITASLSGGPDDLPLVTWVDPRVDDRWLLCSDGLTDYVGDVAVSEALGRDDREEAASALIDLALEAGAADNVTVVVTDVRASDDVPARGTPVFVGAAARRFTDDDPFRHLTAV